MSGRFMRVRKIIIPTITAVIIASQLCGCASNTQSELHHMIENGDQIEIEVIEPDFEEQGTESTLTWAPLAELTNYLQFREGFDKLFNIEQSTYTKNGVLYIDSEGNKNGNNTLYNVFTNKNFIENYWEKEEVHDALSSLALQLYADVDEDSTDALYASINAYFNLLADHEVNYYNGQMSLSRAEAMALLMRAITPVEELKTNDKFTTAVGKTDFTDYAGYVAEDSYLTLDDKSLNNQTFNGTITRGEFIYMVVNNIFGSDIISTTDISKVVLNDCKESKEKHEYKEKYYIKSYDLDYAIQNPDSGVPADLYKAIAVANKIGVIGSETRWDEALTKSEGIEILVDAILASNSLKGYRVEVESGKIAEDDYTSRAVEKYKEVADKVSVPESSYVEAYLELIEKGSTPEDAEAYLLDYFKSLTGNLSEQETEAPTEAETEAPTEMQTPEPTIIQIEKPTETQTQSADKVNPFTIEPSGSYIDTLLNSKAGGQRNWYLRTFENGAQRYVFRGKTDMLNFDKYYYIDTADEIPDDYYDDFEKAAEAYDKQHPTEAPTEKPTQAPTQASAGNNSGNGGSSGFNPFENWGKEPESDWFDPNYSGGIY